MAEAEQFTHLMRLADQLVETASKEQIAECARLLALNIAHYQSKFGFLPLDETLALLSTETLSKDQKKLVADAMEALIGILGMLTKVGSDAASEGTLH